VYLGESKSFLSLSVASRSNRASIIITTLRQELTMLLHYSAAQDNSGTSWEQSFPPRPDASATYQISREDGIPLLVNSFNGLRTKEQNKCNLISTSSTAHQLFNPFPYLLHRVCILYTCYIHIYQLLQTTYAHVASSIPLQPRDI
jgi:hypothetical protein